VSRRLTVDRYADALERYMGKTVDDVRWGQRVRHPEAMTLIEVTDVTDKLDLLFSTG
jgi:heptosyltransferase I